MRPRPVRAPTVALALAFLACNASAPDAPGPVVAPVEAPTEPPPIGEREHTPGAGARFAENLRDAVRAQVPPDSRTDSPGWEAFYAPDAVHEVRVTLTEAARDDLQSDGRTWVPAVVSVDGQVFPHAGVRRKGSTTWQNLSGKPSLKIKLREFGDGPRLVGLERLTLNNMVSDPTQAREVITLRLWRALGSNATRASFAQVWIDEEPYGLYSNVEALDDEWLQRRYDHPDGTLWEANNDADFTEAGLPFWELSEGSADDEALLALTAALQEDGPFETRVGAVVNVPQFLRYWATCLATGATDGYPFHLNDAYVYADPGNGGRLDFVPWGMDEAWVEPFSHWTAGELAAACEADPACEEALAATVVDVLARFEALDVDGMVTEAYATSEPLLSADPKVPYPRATIDAARDELRARIAGWPDKLRVDLGL